VTGRGAIVVAALCGCAVAALAAFEWWPRGEPARPAPQLSVRLDAGASGAGTERYVYEVSVHTPREIDSLLNRIEELAPRLQIRDNTPGFALVLHGPEVEFFASRNYERYRALVDRAARLDAGGVIEVKICQTQLRARGIPEEEIPAFIERVPFGPDEVRRLGQRGYVVM